MHCMKSSKLILPSSSLSQLTEALLEPGDALHEVVEADPALQLTEALLKPGDALHEVVEADPALLVAESDGDGAEDAAVEAESQRLQRRSKLVQVEEARPVHVNAFEHVL